MTEITRRQHCYDYPRPAVTVDIIVLSRVGTDWQVLLIRRKHDPFAGRWALPGGFVDENETLEAAAARELKEETGVRGVQLTQLHAFGDPGRDPRGWTVSVAFYVVLDAGAIKPQAADDAAEVGWFPLEKLPAMAFDHEKILGVVKERVGQAPVAGEREF